MIVTPIMTTAAEMDKPKQETGEHTQESSPTVGTLYSVNGTLLTDSSEVAVINTHEYFYTSNAKSEEVVTDEASVLYTEPSQEVGYNKSSALVTGTAAVDPEVKVMYPFLTPTLILALIAILLKRAES